MTVQIIENPVGPAAITEPSGNRIIVHSAENTAEAARQAQISESWAEGTLPGGAGTKSAKEHATEAAVSAASADATVLSANVLLAVESYALASLSMQSIDEILPIYTDGVFLDPTNSKNVIAGTAASALSSLTALTHSRASTGLALDNSGIYQSFGIDALRATDRGILLEAAATNLVAAPQDVTGTGWSGTSYTVTTGQVSPDVSGNTGRLLTRGATDTSGKILAVTISAAGTYYLSFVLKKAALRYTLIYSSGAGLASTQGLAIDWDAGATPTATEMGGGVGPYTLISITPLANGFFRFVFLPTALSAGTLTTIFRTSSDGTYATRGSGGVSGDGVVYFWHAQVEKDRYSSPILTGGGTRGADAASIVRTFNSEDHLSVKASGQSLVEYTASGLSSLSSWNLVTDFSAPWLGQYITQIVVVPALSKRALRQKIGDVKTALTNTVISPIRITSEKVAALNSLKAPANSAPNVYETDNGASLYLTKRPGLFFWNNTVYSSEAEMIAAAGGTLVSSVVTLSNYSDGVNIISGKDYNSFSAVGTGAALTASGSEWQLDTTATTGTVGIQLALDGPPARGLRFTTKARRGTAGSGTVSVGIGSFTNGSSADGIVSITSTTQTSLTAHGNFTSGSVVLAVTQSGGTRGTVFLQDPVLSYCDPAQNFPQGIWTIVLAGSAPATVPGTTQVLAKLSGNSTRNTTQVELTSTGDVIFRRLRNYGTGVSESNESVTLGTLTGGQSFRIAVFMSNTLMGGAMNGAGASKDISGALGATHFYIGSGFTGTISEYSVYAGAETLDWCEQESTLDASKPMPLRRKNRRSLMVNGDSYSILGSTGIGFHLSDLGWEVTDVGVGGTTFAQQATVQQARTDLFAIPQVWWDGSPNGHTNGDNSPEKTAIAAWVSNIGHDQWVYVRSGQIPLNSGTDYSAAPEYEDMTTLYNWVIATYGLKHAYDPQPITEQFAISDPATIGYTEDQADIAAGRFPRSGLSDGIHLKYTLLRAIAADMQRKFVWSP